MNDIGEARSLARDFLAEALPRRWSHVQGVAAQAERVATDLGLDRRLLVSAAWLHDIGYAPQLASTGFHPLDGAVMLAASGWPDRVVALVAHHGEARVTAGALGLEVDLLAFPREEGPLTDALVYADLAAGPDGRRMSLRDRLDAMADWHADDPPVLREAWGRRRAALLAAAARTEQRMAGMHRGRLHADPHPSP